MTAFPLSALPLGGTLALPFYHAGRAAYRPVAGGEKGEAAESTPTLFPAGIQLHKQEPIRRQHRRLKISAAQGGSQQLGAGDGLAVIK